MILGAIASIAGIGLSVLGQSEASKQAEKQEKYQQQQAEAERKAAEKSAKIAKEILAEQKENMKYNVNVLKQVQVYQDAATAAVYDEQEARKRELLLDARFAADDTMRQFLKARGEALYRASGAGAYGQGTGGSGVFGSLGELNTSLRIALSQTALDVATGLEIFEAQGDYAAAVSEANKLQTKASIKNLKSQYKENRLRGQLGAAQVPSAVAAPSANTTGPLLSSAGSALVGASSSIDRFSDQIFGS